MSTHTHTYEQPVRVYARHVGADDIPPPSFASALDRVRQEARTRAGMVCGVVIAALVQFLPESGVHGFKAAILALTPAVAIAAVAFPLIAWAARRGEAHLRRQYDIRRR
jgi:hypothetical protein